MNHIAEVAKLLGVEIGEEFFVTGGKFQSWTEGMYTLKEGGLYSSKGENACGILSDLIIGIHSIKRKPWKPNPGEQYWYPLPTYKDFAFSTEYVSSNPYDTTRLERGLVFRTEEEAVEVAKKMLKALEADQ